MRNALALSDQLIVAIDNSGAIGEKKGDAVHVADEVAAYFTARVTLLELLCAGAKPTAALLANFTGEVAWPAYVRGIERLFAEIGWACPPIAGSTETNFSLQQSAFSLTMLGEKKWELQHDVKRMHYYVIGRPLVGQSVMTQQQDVVSMAELVAALQQGHIQALWPTGSKGLLAEIERFIGGGTVALPLHESAGPSTAVLVAVEPNCPLAHYFTAPVTKIEHIGGE